MKPTPDRSSLFSACSLALATSLMLSACGGGSSSGDASASTAMAAPVAAAGLPDNSASAPVDSSAPALPEAQAQATPEQLLTQAMQASIDTPLADAPPSPAGDNATAGITPGSDATDATALAAPKTAAADASPRASNSSGRVFYVDSKAGNDASNGLVASAGAAGAGPWRSLAKLRAVALAAGDTVRLACGSEWNETLSVGASGTATQPITLAAYPDGCTTKPQVNGSVSIAASQWSVYSSAGSIKFSFPKIVSY